MAWHTRLKELVAERGMSLAELSRRSGVNYDNVTKYVGGAVENPRGKTLEKLASALGTTTLYLREGLTDRKPLTVGSIPYRGVVAAGLWAEAGDALSEPEEWLPFNPVPQYPEGAVYCLTVQGDSLDKIAPHGTTLVVVDLLASGIPRRGRPRRDHRQARPGGEWGPRALPREQQPQVAADHDPPGQRPGRDHPRYRSRRVHPEQALKA
jgi:transcriptional regulator with XRE-family HTH domain